MRNAAKLLGVEAPKMRGGRADQELLGLLRVEVNRRLATLPIDDHVQCVRCGELATDDTPFCPFCGDEGNPEGAAAEVVEQVVAQVPEEASVGIAEAPVQAPAANVDAANLAREADLTKRLNRIMELKRSAVGMSYDIGQECREIRDQQLYKARGYASFKQFAEAELPFTRESALQLISIVEKYSRDDYEKIGYAKLRVISAVTGAEQKVELLDQARKGATTRELTERAKRGSVAPPAASSGAKKAPPAETSDKITLLLRVGSRAQVMKFHDASKGGETLESAGLVKGLVSTAYGELEIADGVVVRIGLRVDKQNNLNGLTFKLVRAADDAE